MPFKKFQMNETANQIKYWQIEAVNFTIGQWNHFCRIMILHSKHNEEKILTQVLKVKKLKKLMIKILV